MKRLPLILLFVLTIIGSVNAQVPRPMNTNSSSNGLQWTKHGEYDFTLKKDGRTLSNTKYLKNLRTDTLSVMDMNTRDIYYMPDFESASVGASGKAVLLAKNVGNNFYLTNPKSFVLYTDDEYISGDFVNINGSYVYYVPEKDATYYLKDIRSFNDWGANTATKMEYSPNNVYWCRVAENQTYHVVEKGQSMDYSNVTTEKSGNDMLVKRNGQVVYTLPGYYNMASYVFKPAKGASGNSSNGGVTSSNCVQGDCQNGWGKMEYEGGHYDGFWKNGKKDGYGLYKWEGYGKYIGSWENDNMNGYGVYIADNNDNIIGHYENGELNGLGITVSGDDWDQGMFRNGNIATHYDFFSTGNDTGCTAGDCENKYGRFKWSNGDSFTGFFKNGKMHMGTYTFSSGDKYSGMFNSNNQFHGMGRFFFSDGSYYGGEWSNGKYEGRGYYHDSSYSQKIGEWSNGELVRKMK
tara:strand:- start:19 stop:1407 length:1389 start_codon:yes stop_codon:yes gene_type:complete